MRALAKLLTPFLVGGLALSLSALEIKTGEKGEMNLGGRMQLYGVGQIVKDPYRNDGRVYLFLRQSRLSVRGQYDGYRYDVQLAFAGESEIATPNAGSGVNTLDLLDYSVEAPVGSFYIKAGQFKVPYGRERLTDSGNMQFANRSIADLPFVVGRDVGAALSARKGVGAATFGVFTAGGRDVPERYLPETLGLPLMVFRAGVGDLDDDLYFLTQTGSRPDGLKKALFLNALFTEDTQIGHSTSLQVKRSDKSLLLNSNWNPYIARTPTDRGRLWQAGLDMALRGPAGKGAFSLEVQGDVGEYHNKYGTLNVGAGRVQAGWRSDPVELAVRYAVILPDPKFAKGAVSITGAKPIQELTPAVAWHHPGGHTKIVFDAPVMFRVPIDMEKNVGPYLLTDIPDQAKNFATPATHSLKYQDVVQARVLVQFQF